MRARVCAINACFKFETVWYDNNYVFLKNLVSDACLVTLFAGFFLGGCTESFTTGLFPSTFVVEFFRSSSLQLADSLSNTFSVTILTKINGKLPRSH